ncbi:MAG: hypothetical protein R3C01_01750 [Planctomycetaceae bacterium]
MFLHGGQVYRALTAGALKEWEFVSQQPFFSRRIEAGDVVATKRLDDMGRLLPDNSGWEAVLEHARVPMVSYPYEWSFSMLRRAALLQLELLEESLLSGVTLKDATPYNVQFMGTVPTMIDVASFIKYDGKAPWYGYRQFCQMNLFPLMLQALRGVDFQPFLRGRLEGITPRECRGMIPMTQLWRRGVISHVYLHAMLDGQQGGRPATDSQSLTDQGFGAELILNNVRKLRKIVDRLRWGAKESRWSNYDAESEPVRLDAAAKEQFIREVASQRRRASVWDFGCNLGRYSRIAAEHADQVLALDFDHLTIDRLYNSLHAEGNRRILPLVFNVADASPGLGWRGLERKRLQDRGRPELTLALALIHHLVIGAYLPMSEVIDWFADLGGELVIEFVDREDPQVKSLLVNRSDVIADYCPEVFLKELSRRFEVIRVLPLPSRTRTIYHARVRPADK